MAKISIKTIALSTLIATTSTAISTTVSAADEYAELNLGIGRILFGDELDDATHYHIGLGHTLTDRWSLELVGSRYKADMQETGMEVEGTQYRLDALYHFGDDQSWRPYVAFGAGDQRRSPDIGEASHDTLLNAGVGLKARLARNWEWRTDVRAFNSLDEEHTDVVFSTGNLAAGIGPAASCDGAGADEPGHDRGDEALFHRRPALGCVFPLLRADELRLCHRRLDV